MLMSHESEEEVEPPSAVGSAVKVEVTEVAGADGVQLATVTMRSSSLTAFAPHPSWEDEAFRCGRFSAAPPSPLVTL